MLVEFSGGSHKLAMSMACHQRPQLLSQVVTCLYRLQASELFPTENRGMAHGISAAVGKLGALSADIIMGVASPHPALLCCPEVLSHAC